jgi:hypothetical protein
MRKFSSLSDKIGKKGYNFNPNKKVFHPRRDDKNKTCYNYGEKGHISPNCSKPVKRRSSSKNKQVQESIDLHRLGLPTINLSQLSDRFTEEEV